MQPHHLHPRTCSILAVAIVGLAVGAWAQPSDDSNDRFVAAIGADAYQFSPAHPGELGRVRLFTVLSHPDAAVRGEVGDILWRLEIRGPDDERRLVRVARGSTRLDFEGLALAEVAWDGRDRQGALVPQGMYHYTFRARFLPDALGPRPKSQRYEEAEVASAADEAYASTDDVVVRYDLSESEASELRVKSAAGACAPQQNLPLESGFPYSFYYGTTHTHSNFSDGGLPTSSCTSSAAGVGNWGPAEVFDYARVSAGLDYLFVADHNHMFDDSVNRNTPPLTEAKVRQRYQEGLAAAAAASVDGSFVAAFGIEFGVTTNSDQGHVIVLESPALMGWETCSSCTGANPECTPGSNCYFDVYVPKRYGYLTLYARSVANPSSAGPLGILCHPGSAEFDNYAYNTNADAAMQGIAVRSGLAYSAATSCSDANTASSDYVSKWKTALSKGFHVGPTGESDAHCNNYGLAVPTRTVYLLPNAASPALTRANLLTAHKNRHFFAAEDPNLQLVFATSNGHVMGDIFTASSPLTLRAAVYDPDSEATSLIEIWRGQVGSVPSSAYRSTSNQATFSITESLTSGTYYYFAHVRQADGHDAWSAPVWVTYSSGADFSLAASPTSLSVVQGGSGASTVTATPANGFTSAVSLAASGLPAGATAAFSPTSIAGGSGSSTLTFTVGASTAAGTYPVTVTGTSGSLTHTTSVSLTVTAAATPSFSLAASPTSLTVGQGGSGASTVTATPVNGFATAISLSASGLPSGTTAALSPTSIAGGSGSSTLTFTVGASTAAGTYPVTVTGTGGSLTRTTSVSLTVTAGCSSSTSPITSGSPLGGTLATTDCTTTPGAGSGLGYYDSFTFSGTSGQAVTITLDSTAFDAYLKLLNPSDAQVAYNDDGNGGTNSKITYTLAATGTFKIVATTYYATGGSNTVTGAYTVTLTGGSTPTVPTAPSGLSATAASSSQVNLAWTDNSANETGFEVDRSTDGSSWTQLTTTAANATSYSATGLTASTLYYFRVRATNAAGDSASSNTASATTPGSDTELVANGGFEATGTWTYGTYASRVTTSPQTGSYCAKLLGRGTTTSSGASVYQPPSFPTAGAVKTLRFYLKISSAEGTTTAYDYLYVRVKSSAGTTLATLATYSNQNKSTYAGWVQVTLSIPATYAVSGNRLYFEGTEDSSLQTTFYLDGVSIQ